MSYQVITSELNSEMREWRHHLHQYPETAYEEIATSRYIAEKLTHFGLDEVHLGLAGTGVVGRISAGSSKRSIALRADIDALHIHEQNDFTHRSKNDGKMHACGHDGHTAMLLGAAKYLSSNRLFNGTINFIFQPAEEGRAGAKRMIDEGLFDKFPSDYVFGLHNFHDIPVGHFAIKPGSMMASFDCFEISVTGQATHAALPHLGQDVIVTSAQIINNLQTIVSRSVNPQQAAVVSITQIHSGNTWNALPETAVLRGTFRCFSKSVQNQIAEQIAVTVKSICEMANMKGTVKFNPDNPGYPVTENDEASTNKAIEAAALIAGEHCINTNPEPSMGSEDFAFMLQEKPGCYIWLGNGPSEGGCLLHNPHYDFNDDILSTGASYWIKLANTMLP